MSATDHIAQARIKTEIELRRQMDEAVLRTLVALEQRIQALEERMAEKDAPQS